MLTQTPPVESTMGACIERGASEIATLKGAPDRQANRDGLVVEELSLSRTFQELRDATDLITMSTVKKGEQPGTCLQSRFSTLIRQIIARNSAWIGGRPPVEQDFQRQ
jgi:hypothetical protein